MVLYLQVYVKLQVTYHSKSLLTDQMLRGGTTIGPVTAANLTIPVIDMGAPVLGMHSIRELASVKDNYVYY